jgi:hypothetical protein
MASEMNVKTTPRTQALLARHQAETESLPDNPPRDVILQHARRQALELLTHALCIEAALTDRDKDWILAMAAALGANSGFAVPIVPTVEAFKALFHDIRAGREDAA